MSHARPPSRAGGRGGGRNASTSRPSIGCVRLSRQLGAPSRAGARRAGRGSGTSASRRRPTIEARKAIEDGTASSSVARRPAATRGGGTTARGGHGAAEVDDAPHAAPAARRTPPRTQLARRTPPRRRPPSSGSGSRRPRCRRAPPRARGRRRVALDDVVHVDPRAALACRVNPRTSWPAASRAGARSAPTEPVIPVTRVRIGRLQGGPARRRPGRENPADCGIALPHRGKGVKGRCLREGHEKAAFCGIRRCAPLDRPALLPTVPCDGPVNGPRATSRWGCSAVARGRRWCPARTASSGRTPLRARCDEPCATFRPITRRACARRSSCASCSGRSVAGRRHGRCRTPSSRRAARLADRA